MGYTLVYDAGCGPCTTFRNAVYFLDARHRMAYAGLDAAEERGLLSTVPEGQRRRSFHLVPGSGPALSGSAAFADLAAQLPGGLLTSAAIRSCPPLSGALGSAYATLSRLHGSGSCATR